MIKEKFHKDDKIKELEKERLSIKQTLTDQRDEVDELGTTFQT